MESDFVQLISNVGFPIAAFCAMYYMCNNTIKENTKALNELVNIIKDDKEE